jgi:MFS family permease
VICIIASSAPVFIIGRVVTGIGIAAGVPLCATILIDITSPGERATYMASCVGVDVISLAFGALLGGYLETNMDYRKYFKLSFTHPFSRFPGANRFWGLVLSRSWISTLGHEWPPCDS